MDSTEILPQRPRAVRVLELTEEHLAAENAELRERVAELQRDNATLCRLVARLIHAARLQAAA